LGSGFFKSDWCTWLGFHFGTQGKILHFLKVHLMPNLHPLQVNHGIDFVRTFKGFGLVSGFAFPDKELVLAWPVMGC
jgi:hypothetical protein